MSLVSGTPELETNMADPNIGKHAIHWVLCNESYKKKKRPLIDGWELVFEEEETCIYATSYEDQEYAIISFRGTAVKKDFWDDYELASSSKGTCTFPRAAHGKQVTLAFLEEYSGIKVQLTGHSLGGAIARCVGADIGLGVVTFNAAAPPTNPVITRENESNYHIVFDPISAWQTPNCVRLDKGIRGPSTIWDKLGTVFWNNTASKFTEAHTLLSFSNLKPSSIISPKKEDLIFAEWLHSLDFATVLILMGLLGLTGLGFRIFPTIDKGSEEIRITKPVNWDTPNNKTKRSRSEMEIESEEQYETIVQPIHNLLRPRKQNRNLYDFVPLVDSLSL